MELWRITYGGNETPCVIIAGESLAGALAAFSFQVNHPTTITKAEKIEGRFVAQAREPQPAISTDSVDGKYIGGEPGHYYEPVHSFAEKSQGPHVWCVVWRDTTYYNGPELRTYYRLVMPGGT